MEPPTEDVGGVVWKDEKLEVALHGSQRFPLAKAHDVEQVYPKGKACVSSSSRRIVALPRHASRRS